LLPPARPGNHDGVDQQQADYGDDNRPSPRDWPPAIWYLIIALAVIGVTLGGFYFVLQRL
jgi:hypothetical protein